MSSSNNASSANKDSMSWSASAYNKSASFVYSPAFTSPVLGMLEPIKPGEVIADFGCGSGELTRGLMERVGESGLVVGLDSSDDMISKAKHNGATLARVQDVQSPNMFHSHGMEEHGLTAGSFDAVFSNAALHWCKRDPKQVVQNAWEALKPGGRFVVEMGGFANLVGLRAVIHQVLASRGFDPSTLDPWYFPTPNAYRALLESVGFQVKEIGLHPRMTSLGTGDSPEGGLRGWMDLFARKSLLGGLGDEEAGQVMNEVENICEVDMMDERGEWSVMYVRLRFKATKPEETKA